MDIWPRHMVEYWGSFLTLHVHYSVILTKYFQYKLTAGLRENTDIPDKFGLFPRVYTIHISNVMVTEVKISLGYWQAFASLLYFPVA